MVSRRRSGSQIVAHFTERDVFSAHGVSLMSEPYTFTNHLLLDGEDLVKGVRTGLIVRVPVPDGSTSFVAGRADFTHSTRNFVSAPTNGVTRNLDAFCAALAG
jgi:hypothetical protein